LTDLDHALGVVGRRWEGLRGKRIFLTGGTGFVGKWLLATVLEADRRFGLGCEITVLTRNPEAFRRQAPELANAPQVTLIAGDVRHLDPGRQRFSHVIHAATDAVTTGRPLDTFNTCVEGTRRVLDFAAQAGATELLLLSSGAVYGRQPQSLPAITTDFSGGPDTLNVNSAYAEGKRAAEWLTHAYAQEHGIHAKVARCFAFVGPYLPMDRHFAIGNFIRDAMAGLPIVILGDGTPLRSYLHASEMAAWLVGLAARRPPRGGLQRRRVGVGVDRRTRPPGRACGRVGVCHRSPEAACARRADRAIRARCLSDSCRAFATAALVSRRVDRPHRAMVQGGRRAATNRMTPRYADESCYGEDAATVATSERSEPRIPQ
jgi:dTDP-glucose 4,6-dehydratase